MIRPEVQQLVAIGPLPERASVVDDVRKLEEYQRILERIAEPVSDAEAEALAGLFGPDDSFGLAWTLVHLIETAPSWPFVDRLDRQDNEWIGVLRDRAARGK